LLYNKPVSLYSDSLHSMELIENRAGNATNTTLYYITEILSKSAHQVTFTWIPGHLGITGNDISDSLAKQAAIRPTIDKEIRLDLTDAFKKVNTYIDKLHNTTWLQSKSKYRTICPQTDRQIKYIHENKSKDNLITRLQLGHCRLNYYLFKMSLHPDGLCSTCACSETVEHYLIECNNKVASKIKEYADQNKIILNLNTILNSSEFQDIIIEMNTRTI
jgi:hypothetical protein